jgi:chemotaxis protein methyltransferase CheR
MLTVSLREDTFRQIRDIIYKHSGIFIPDTKKYLIENRLTSILKEKKLDNYENYLDLLKVSPNGNELSRLFDAITTNETYFFREAEQLSACVESGIASMMRNGKRPRIRIWSAACSTGEEPYTIAMMLMEKFGTINGFEIYGSDISNNVLVSAARACYSSYSTRNVPQNYLQKYFTPQGKAFLLKDNVKKSVKFRKVNLMDDREMRMMRGMDFIFCRNVLIYFDMSSKKKVVSYLYDCLNPGGYLYIGATESLHNITRAFRPSSINGTVAYRKV